MYTYGGGKGEKEGRSEKGREIKEKRGFHADE